MYRGDNQKMMIFDTIYDTANKIHEVKQQNADAKKENRLVLL